MNSRERVLKAINHQEPDRLPVFKPNVIQTYEPFSDPVQDFMDNFEFDRFEGLGGITESPSTQRELPDQMFEDGYGCKFRYKGVGLPYCVHSPLAEAETVEDVERFDWPDPGVPGLVASNAREKARVTRERGNFATATGVEMLLHRYHYVRGFEQWFLDIKTNPEMFRAIADRIHHINLTMAMRLLEEVGDYTDIVTNGDDLGTSTAPFISPADFREYVKPYFADLIGTIKGRCPHVRFYLHSHGQIMDLLPDLIECGLDILNPILPLDHMDPYRLKREFGHQLSFEGGIDIEHVLLFGSLAEVEKHVKEVIDVLSPGGGFLFKAQAISHLIPWENLKLSYDLALEYGRYQR